MLISFLRLYNAYYKIKTNKTAFGVGDFDVLFIIGTHLKLYNGLICLLIACLLALIFNIKNKSEKVAFIPYIMIAFIICLYIT